MIPTDRAQTTITKLRKEASRATPYQGFECCAAPEWTCCDHKLLLEAAELLEMALADEGTRRIIT